jgi:ubiquinone/menaquinone biosynthesis C-methylase UbiE
VTRDRNPFDDAIARYDGWFDSPKGRVLFENELAAIRLLWRGEFRPVLEVGVGTGRFAEALVVEWGIDPAKQALRLAEQRGVQVRQARGEALPFANATFGCVLMVTTLCFADDSNALLGEVARVLRPDGHLLIADIPADTAWGRHYLQKKADGHPLYRDARFFTGEEITDIVRRAGLSPVGFSSTLIESKPERPKPEAAQPGWIVGAGFICVLCDRAELASMIQPAGRFTDGKGH